MNVWTSATQEAQELVVGLILRYGNLYERADDTQFAVAWMSNGTAMSEVDRIPMSCADVDLVVPSRGPYVYEVRLDLTAGSMHPECACTPGTICPAGVEAIFTESDGNETTVDLTSPINSHFVAAFNEWGEHIADSVTLGQQKDDINAEVAAAGDPPDNAKDTAGTDPDLACPASRDEPLGTHDVTKLELAAANISLPAGRVTGKWCLVRRGVCDETAKVKVCELSGAIGTIIVDTGNFDNDQQIKVLYNWQASERGLHPVLFLSHTEGDALFVKLAANMTVNVTIGPSIGGTPPGGYNPGSGIIVHAIGPGAAGLPVKKKSYPALFGTVGWAEVSPMRDIMFVCLPSLQQIRIYDVSHPMTDITLIATITRPCAREATHDYRTVDFRSSMRSNNPVERFNTAFVDPEDSGNMIYYYDTENVSNPTLVMSFRATWEHEVRGLGQVRPGGPGDRYHFVTWHCSNLFCDNNNGQSVYVLDSDNLLNMPPRGYIMNIPLLTSSAGSFARDIACGKEPDGVCLVSLTWDGILAIDPGLIGSVNSFQIVAAKADGPFQNDSIPLSHMYLKMFSGAQKVYASKTFDRSFYVEQADFNHRQLRMGDTILALQQRELYMARLKNYNKAVKVRSPAFPGMTIPTSAPSYTQPTNRQSNLAGLSRERDGESNSHFIIELLAGLLVSSCCVIFALVGVVLLVRRQRRKEAERQQQHIDAQSQSRYLSRDGNGGQDINVVVGRPVEAAGSDAFQGHAMPSSPTVAVAPPRARSEQKPGP